MHDTWGHGQLLAFSGIDGATDYATGLTLRTIGPGCALAAKLPGVAEITIDAQPPARCLIGGDHLDLTLADGRRVRGALLDAWHLLLEGPVTIGAIEPAIRIVQRGERTLVASAAHCRPEAIAADLDLALAARRRWVGASPLLPLGPSVGKALSQLKSMVYAPEGILRHRWSTPDRWPHRGCWLWDSAFHAIGARHVDVSLARDLLSAVLDGQRPDGRVPLRIDPDGTCHPEYTQPPTLALATWCVEHTARAPEWAATMAAGIERSLDWDLAHRDGGNGLPYWAIEGNLNCRSGESGLDNASRFDSATRMEAVDFASFLTLEYELLGRLYARDGRSGDSQRCAAKAEKLRGLIRTRLWDEASGFFRDRDLEHDGFCLVAAVTGFLPLICGAATPAQAQRLAERLADPAWFGTRVPLPSVARTDPTYTDDMWRGPVWVNMVWLVSAGFARYGLHAEATRLRTAMVAEIERWRASHGTFFEYFDADGVIPPDRLRRKGRLAPDVSFYHQCFHDYGWTATLYLDLVCAKDWPLPAI